MVSLALRSGVPLEKVIQQLERISGETPIFTNGQSVLSIPDAIASALRTQYTVSNVKDVMDDLNLASEKPALKKKECPECHHYAIIFENNCQRCVQCGYSKCE